MLGRMPTTAKIYMAGPLGFSEAGRHFYRSVFVPFVAGLGYEVIDPWAHTDQRKIEAIERLPPGPARPAAWRALNHEIGAATRAAIDRAHGAIGLLDGPDVDPGP